MSSNVIKRAINVLMMFLIIIVTDVEVYASDTSMYDYEVLENGHIEIQGVSLKYYDQFGYIDADEDVIIIPGEIDGLIVERIGNGAFEEIEDWFDYELADLYIGDNIREIDEYAFSSSGSIKEVYIPDSMLRIGKLAFYGCNEIESIHMNEGLLSIGDFCFELCRSITNVTIPSSVYEIGTNPFCDCSSLVEINVDMNNNTFYSNGKMIIRREDGYLVSGVTGGMDELTIPDTVVTIGGYSFKRCSFFTIIIPKNVKSIEEYAFARSAAITDVYIYSDDIVIDEKAFYGCTNMRIHAHSSSSAAVFAKEHGIIVIDLVE